MCVQAIDSRRRLSLRFWLWRRILATSFDVRTPLALIAPASVMNLR
jgi:hypothetical protein